MEPFTNVSDTARWMAVYRAEETQRPDSLFSDHLADRLAGTTGRSIAAGAPRLSRSGWWWVTRTKVIDDFVRSAIDDGCGRVLNLAAGLDTRPYRLELPNETRWIEVDAPDLIDEKGRRLSGETPRCELSRVAVDLADEASRRAFLAEATDGADRTLVITEGLLPYLEPSAVRGLARDLRSCGIAWWITDLLGPRVVRHMMRRMPSLAKAPMKFGPADGVAFFEREGWTLGDVRSMLKEANRLKRLPAFLRPLALLPNPNLRRLGRSPWSGVLQLTPDGRNT